MPLIPSRRPAKPAILDDEAPRLVVPTTLAKKGLIPLKRAVDSEKQLDLSEAKIRGLRVVRDGVRGDYRGERKESLRTIERGEQGGSEEGEGGERETAPAYLAPIIQKAKIAFVRRQEKVAEKAKHRPAPVPKIDRVWFEACTKHFPRGVPPLWDMKHRGLAKHLMNRIGAEETMSLIVWAVENWTAMNQSAFKWMTKAPPPAQPSFPWLVKNVHVFKEWKDKGQDAPLQVETLIKGLNLAKAPETRRSPITPPVPLAKPLLPKKDLSATVHPSPIQSQTWRD